MISLATSVAQQLFPPPSAGHISVKLGESGPVTIFCYENEVPSFVEIELDRLYGNFFSTLAHFKESGRFKNASTYVVFEDGKVTTAFLFRQENRVVRVLNEVLRIEQSVVNQFTNYIFSTYGSVDVILFHAVDTNTVRLHHPCQRINCLEDIVLALPDTPEAYFKHLGKSMRKTIKGYSNKLRREFPTFQVSVYEKDEASEEQIRTLIEFNRTRLLSTGRISTFDEAAIQHIIQYVKLYGMTCIGKIDGKICAGSISYRVGDNYFMHVSAHDPVYDRYRLGVQFRYLTICECIRRGGKECHFLWGRQEFKYDLLGVRRDLHDLVVYRSRARVLLEGGMAFHNLLNGVRRQAGLLAHACKVRGGELSNFSMRLLSRVGMLRRSA